MTWNGTKRNSILGVFLQKRNVTFFSVFLWELGTDRNFVRNSRTPLLDYYAEVVMMQHIRDVSDILAPLYVSISPSVGQSVGRLVVQPLVRPMVSSSVHWLVYQSIIIFWQSNRTHQRWVLYARKDQTTHGVKRYFHRPMKWDQKVIFALFHGAYLQDDGKTRTTKTTTITTTTTLRKL